MKIKVKNDKNWKGQPGNFATNHIIQGVDLKFKVWGTLQMTLEFRVGKHNLAQDISNAQYNPLHIKVYFPYNDSPSV